MAGSDAYRTIVSSGLLGDGSMDSYAQAALAGDRFLRAGKVYYKFSGRNYYTLFQTILGAACLLCCNPLT